MEIKNRLSDPNEEYLYSGKLSDLVSALCENEQYLTPDIIQSKWMSKIKEIRTIECSPSIAEWAGEGYFLNILPNYVTSGNWNSNEEFDEENPNYRGKDTVPIEDFQDLLLFVSEYIEIKYHWALSIYYLLKEIAKSKIPLFEEKLSIKEYSTFCQLKKYGFNFELRRKSKSYWFSFSKGKNTFECIIKENTNGSKKFYFEYIFSSNYLDIFKNLFSLFSEDDTLTYSTKFKLVEERFNTQNIISTYKDEIMDFTKNKSIPTSGRFILKVLKPMIGEKLFNEILSNLEYKVDSNGRYFNSANIEYRFSIIASSSNLNKYQIWIIAKRNKNFKNSIPRIKKYWLTKENTVANIV